MGSYAGGSDWDVLPSASSFEAFKPAPKVTPRAVGPEEALPLQPAEEGLADKKRLNAIFAFDTTGSMIRFIESTRDKMDYLASGLLSLLDMEIQIIGVGDHTDGRNLMQIHPFERDPAKLKAAIESLSPTDGGDTPEAFECLFRVLGSVHYPTPTVLVLVTDSIPHDMDDYEGDDDGCPLGTDWLTEIEELKKKLKKIYLVSCATDPHILALQRSVVGANALIQIEDVRRLVNLVMALCMSEAGDLDRFMSILERQRGPERRAEVLSLLGRSVSG